LLERKGWVRKRGTAEREQRVELTEAKSRFGELGGRLVEVREAIIELGTRRGLCRHSPKDHQRATSERDAPRKDHAKGCLALTERIKLAVISSSRLDETINVATSISRVSTGTLSARTCSPTAAVAARG
jgi:hypothetical protein